MTPQLALLAVGMLLLGAWNTIATKLQACAPPPPEAPATYSKIYAFSQSPYEAARWIPVLHRAGSCDMSEPFCAEIPCKVYRFYQHGRGRQADCHVLSCLICSEAL